MNTSQLPHHMRIAALQGNFEGGEENTLRVPELWKEFGFDTEQLFHPLSELYSAVFDKEKHGELLGKYIKVAADSGIKIILYLNCHILLESQADMAEEWARKNADGTYTRLYETYLANCLNSSWMDYFLRVVEDLAEYSIAGIFFDGPTNTVCYCERCAAEFTALYGKSMSDATEQELAAFSLRTQLNAKRIMSAKVKEVNPDWISYFNEGLMNGKGSTEEMREALSYNDIIGTEGGFQFYGPPKDVPIWRCGISAKMTEAVADGRRTVIFMAGDHKPWSWYLHTPAETKLCYASAIANGAGVWYGIHCATSALQSSTGKAVREMVQFDKNHSALYQNTKSIAKVAIFRSFDTAKTYTTSGEITDLYASESKATGGIGNFTESFNGAVATLFRSNIPFDIVTELNINKISQYSVVLAPTSACLSEHIIEAFANYVSDGGCLIADSEFGLYDERMCRLESPGSAKLLGVDSKCSHPYNSWDYFYFTEKGANLADPGVNLIPAPLTVLEVKPHDKTTILGEVCHSLAGRYAGKPEKGAFPFITECKYGKGLVYYLAGTYFELYNNFSITHYRKCIESLIKNNIEFEFELLGASEAVEITIRCDQNTGNIIVHLVNYTGGMSRPINKVVPLNGLRLKVPASIESAESLAGNSNLTVCNGEIELPTLNEFDVIVIHRNVK